jgi:CubicO group peptidase (beta-lactamase class C family)
MSIARTRLTIEQPIYFPGPDEQWERRAPEQVGLDAVKLTAAVAFAEEHETPWPRDIHARLLESNHAEGAYGEIVGPTAPRGGPAGLILRHGYIVAEWGDTARVDMTFSASKSYLATLAGLAVDRGLIRDLDDLVREYVDDGGFDSPHNRTITWRHLLQQTSEWEGTLWDKPDLVDHNRGVGGVSWTSEAKGTRRELREPGTHWEYNDVRVNRLALALLRVWRRALPEVFKEAIMDPIDASETWQWHGYRNSFVTIDGKDVQSVSGGGHWGGGVWVSTLDHARFGYLHLRRGRWRDTQLLSEQWIDTATTPASVNPTYGCLWWLNTGHGLYPSAPESSVFALGAGTNMIWIDPDHDLVAVVRWIETGAPVDGFIGHVLAAVSAVPDESVVTR